MPTANVNVSFEAADLAAAQATIEGWTLHEGCQVYVSMTESLPSGETDEAGNVRAAPSSLPPPEGEG